jgi:thioredoxin 2
MPETQQLVCPHCHVINRVASDRIADGPICGECKEPLLDGEPLDLTSDTFDRHIGNSDWPVLVDFWAPWCGPCRMMTPIIHSAAKELRTTMRVAKLDTEAEGQIAARFGIRSIPTLMVFHRGKVLLQRTGGTDLASLLKWAKSALD